MNQVQKGGVSNSTREYIKNEEVHKRPIPDRAFMLKSDEINDTHLFKTMMSPGKFHYLYGGPGVGKTHLLMNMMCLLHQGYDHNRDWEIVTNVFMYRIDGNGSRVCTPDYVHHIDTIGDFFKLLTELSDGQRKIALFLDDFDSFFSSDGDNTLSKNLRMLILNRKKLGILLFFSDATNRSDFVSNEAPTPYTADYTWNRYKSREEWEKYKKDTNQVLDWNYLDTSGFITNNGGFGHIRSTITEWTDFSKQYGWFYDRDSHASVLRPMSNFDLDSFWYGLGNISSLEINAYIRKYTSMTNEEIIQKGKEAQTDNSIVEMAVKMKSMGLTDESIEYVLGKPKTTLRRWAEKAGYVWKTNSMIVPAHYKTIRANDIQ